MVWYVNGSSIKLLKIYEINKGRKKRRKEREREAEREGKIERTEKESECPEPQENACPLSHPGRGSQAVCLPGRQPQDPHSLSASV